MKDNFLITKISNVIFVGKDEYKEKRLAFRRHLDCNELIFHLSGMSAVHFNGVFMKILPDTVRFLPKGENKEYVVDVETRGDCIDVFFDTDVPISEKAFAMYFSNDQKTKALFKKLFSIWVAKNEGYYFECMSILYRILSRMQTGNSIPRNHYEIIKPALLFIDENFLNEKISVGHLSELCGVSPSYLKKLFLKNFGVPPVRYVIGLKINYACDLLQSNLYSVGEISEKCGYSDVYYFSRQFKEHMGISPTEFKRKYKSSK